MSLDSLIRITSSAAALNGTTAHLIADDRLTIHELMYAMMLPSGNDAAQSLALYFGAYLHTKGKIDPN
jgi:serine-type D-Ala-D-Ala carboxypeptidase (penicillin-binding protein 5/6)